jgi:hypothetical protein
VPKAILPPPVVLASKASTPTATLSEAVVLDFKELSPIAVSHMYQLY